MLDKKIVPHVKEQKTQHVWTFEAVTPNEYFVHGVRCMYRAYSQDEVVQIIEDPTKEHGVFAKVTDVFDFPRKNLSAGILVDGMTIIDHLPNTFPQPYPLVKGSRVLLEDLVNKIDRKFAITNPDVVNEWHDWMNNVAPQSDDVSAFLKDKPLHFPLGDILFSGSGVSNEPILSVEDSLFANLERMRSTDCVAWNRWGIDRDKNDIENYARVGHALLNGSVTNVNGLPIVPKIWRKWKQRKILAADEVGEFKFVLLRGDQKDIRSNFSNEGQVIRLQSGGHRIYLKGKRATLVYPSHTQSPDDSFETQMELDWIKWGQHMTCPDADMNTAQIQENGDIVITNNSITNSMPIVAHRQKKMRKSKHGTQSKNISNTLVKDNEDADDIIDTSDTDSLTSSHSSEGSSIEILDEDSEVDDDQDDYNDEYEIGTTVINTKNNAHGIIQGIDGSGRYHIKYNGKGNKWVILNANHIQLAPIATSSGIKNRSSKVSVTSKTNSLKDSGASNTTHASTTSLNKDRSNETISVSNTNKKRKSGYVYVVEPEVDVADYYSRTRADCSANMLEEKQVRVQRKTSYS